jgi:anti-sigma B factor antagonist
VSEIIRLSLHSFTQEDATVVKCTGQLTAGITGVLYQEVKRLIPENSRIVLDLTDLTRMDSMGLGTIVSLYVSARASGCKLELINLSQRVRELLRITKVSSLFEVYGDHPVKLP